MQTAFRVVYSLVVAILFLLFVMLGTRTFYAEPEGPESPWERSGPFAEPFRPAAECDPQGRCFDPATGQGLTEEEARELRQEQAAAEREFQQAVEQFEEEQRRFVSEERAPYRRNVFILSSVLGVVAVAAGLALFRRVEAMPLGLLLGGLAVVIFGWVQAAEDFGEIGMAPLFIVVTVGLVAVLAVGYRFLGLARLVAGNGE